MHMFSLFKPMHCIVHFFLVTDAQKEWITLHTLTLRCFSDLFEDLIGQKGSAFIGSARCFLQGFRRDECGIGSLRLLRQQLDDHRLHVEKQHVHVWVRHVRLHGLHHQRIVRVFGKVTLEEDTETDTDQISTQASFQKGEKSQTCKISKLQDIKLISLRIKTRRMKRKGLFLTLLRHN